MPNGPDSFVRTPALTYPPTEAILVDLTATDHDFSTTPLRGFSIGTAGDLKVDTIHSTGVVIPANNLAVGIQHICLVTKIYKAGTTATQIVGWR